MESMIAVLGGALFFTVVLLALAAGIGAIVLLIELAKKEQWGALVASFFFPLISPLFAWTRLSGKKRFLVGTALTLPMLAYGAIFYSLVTSGVEKIALRVVGGDLPVALKSQSGADCKYDNYLHEKNGEIRFHLSCNPSDELRKPAGGSELSSKDAQTFIENKMLPSIRGFQSRKDGGAFVLLLRINLSPTRSECFAVSRAGQVERTWTHNSSSSTCKYDD